MKKYIISLVIVIFISLVALLYLTEDYLKFDRFFTRNIQYFEDVHKTLQNDQLDKLKIECNYFSKNIHLSNSNKVDIVISDKNSVFLKNNYPKIHIFLSKNKFSKKIILLHNGNIIFYLKKCDRENCIKDNGGYHGDYVHFLSKDLIKFESSSYSKIIITKKFGLWTYYLVWYQKG